jgi:multidrug transporter EmrE-like cation transporter
MSPASLAFILGAVLLGTAAQLLLKAGAAAVPFGWALALDARVLAGAACYGLSLVVWLAALASTPVSVAYPMVSLGFALNAALAWWLLGEAVTPMRWAGIAVIILGVILVARS